MTPMISDTALEMLNDAAPVIQKAVIDRHGRSLAIPQINEILSKWLELSIEELCADAAEHCCTGSRDYAFNRHDFDRLVGDALLEQEQETRQMIHDHRADRLDRAA